MNFRNRKNDDQVAILDDDVEVNPIEENDIIEVVSVYKPKRQFIEPAVLLTFAAFSIYETILPNTIEIQFCKAVLNISEDRCLNSSKENLVKIQQFTSIFQLLRPFIEVIIPSIIAFFVGPWSDAYGRKPLILSAIIGYSTTYALWTFASSVPTLDPLYFLFFSLPVACGGGFTIILMGISCYVCDVTTLENRGTRLGRLQGVTFAGTLTGLQLCPKLLPFGYTFMFGVSSIFLYVALLYLYFFLDESIIPSQDDLNSPKRNPFHLSHVREFFESCYTKQTPKIRVTLLLTTLVLLFSTIIVWGELGVLYLFVQNVLNWKLPEFTTLNSFIFVVNALGAYGGTWLLSSKLKLHDLLALSISTFFAALSSLVMIFGYRVWHIYLAMLLMCPLGVTGSIGRSFLSRIIAKDELGKVFSLIALAESSTSLFSSLMYNPLYDVTLITFPYAVFFLSAFLALFMMMLLVILVQMHVPPLTTTSLTTL